MLHKGGLPLHAISFPQCVSVNWILKFNEGTVDYSNTKRHGKIIPDLHSSKSHTYMHSVCCKFPFMKHGHCPLVECCHPIDFVHINNIQASTLDPCERQKLVDFDEWVANCKSTIVSQQCGWQLDLPKDNGWNQGAVRLYFEWHETTFEQTIEFEKLDANSGYWWNCEFVSKLFERNVAKNVNSFLRVARGASKLSSWKWKGISGVKTVAFKPSPALRDQQPAPNCWDREEEGIVVPYPKAPSTRI